MSTESHIGELQYIIPASLTINELGGAASVTSQNLETGLTISSTVLICPSISNAIVTDAIIQGMEL